MAREVAELPLPHPDVIPEAKAALGDAIRARLRALYRTQEEAAQALGMPQTNLAYLYTGKLNRYSLAWLLMTASRCGLNISIEARACDDPRLCA